MTDTDNPVPLTKDMDSAEPGALWRSIRRLLGEEDNKTPLEVRVLLLDEVVRALKPYRQSSPLPFNSLAVHVWVPIPGDRALFQTAVTDLDPPFDVAVRHRLNEAGFNVPKVLPVQTQFHEAVPPALQPAFEKYGQVYVEPQQAAQESWATLYIERGGTEKPFYEIEGKARVNVGRMQQVADEKARIFRRNDIVFLDPQDPSLDEDLRSVNATVSREHAYLSFDVQQGRFIWHNEKGNTTLNREAYKRPMPVGKQPVPLEDGDELYLGKAYVIFRLGRKDA